MSNRETMTLKDALLQMRIVASNSYIQATNNDCKKWADAIEAHSRAAPLVTSDVNPQHVAADIVRFLASRGIECDSLDVLGFVEDRIVPLYLHPSGDAQDARLLRVLLRSFGPEYDLTKGPRHDILLRMHILPEEEVRRPDGSFDFEASIRNVLTAELDIQDAAMAKENGNEPG